MRAERLGDPALLYWAAMWRYQTAARSGDIDELDRCLAIQGAMAEQLGQPVFAWGHTFLQGTAGVHRRGHGRSRGAGERSASDRN